MNPTTLSVDTALLAKYNKPGPRYTSYPTAPHFSREFSARDYLDEIARNNDADVGRDLSLYFHLPFCRTLCYFCACNVIITHNPGRIERYLHYLKKEIALLSKHIRPGRKVVQIHWGGGTPTYLSPGQIRNISAYIGEYFEIADGAEIGIEIDPRRLTAEHLPAIRESGFNRVSFGVQDLNERVQESINRIQPVEQNRYVIEESRRLGFDSINVDLIYGLPFQTVESYAETLSRMIDMAPDRLAVFNYAHVPWLKKHQKLLPEEQMPDAASRLALLKMIIERLTEAGYVYIGMDHFARPDDELSVALANRTLYRNFQGYSTHRHADVYAMGVTAISQLDGAYAQNVKNTPEYESALDEERLPTYCGYHLTPDDYIRRHVITEIMCNGRLEKAELRRLFGIDFDEYFPDAEAELEPFRLDGLVELHPDRIDIIGDGRLVIRNIAMIFDAYLKQKKADDKPLFSRTI